LLVDAGDAEFARDGRRQRAHVPTIDANPAAIRLMGAGDDFDERGFARAVFAEQRVDFPGF
jgi:hypothetical protein